MIRRTFLKSIAVAVLGTVATIYSIPIEEPKQKEDIVGTIAQLTPEDTPLFQLLSNIGPMRVDWLEDELIPRVTPLSFTEIYKS